MKKGQSKVYKLTTGDNKTRAGASNETQWGPGVTHTALGNGDMCTAAYIHGYAHPYLAVLFNPIHANISNPNLWDCAATVEKTDGLKVGCTELTTIKQIPLPQITPKQRAKFANLVADYIVKLYCRHCDISSVETLAKHWLDGTDRSSASAASYAATAHASAASAAAASYAATASAASASYASAAAAATASYAASYAATACKKMQSVFIRFAKKAMEND
jgi:hypothetical protein